MLAGQSNVNDVTDFKLNDLGGAGHFLWPCLRLLVDVALQEEPRRVCDGGYLGCFCLLGGEWSRDRVVPHKMAK